MKKFTLLIMLNLTLLMFGYHYNKAFASMPVACNAPSASSYPEYYTECVGGTSGTTAVNATYYYVPYKDQYRMDYGTVTGIDNYKLHFVAANGTVYNADYAFAPTGTHYLTCNGRYSLLFYAGSALIKATNEVVTSAIVNPTCSSYAEGTTGINDLSATMTNGVINWTAKPDATIYEIYKDGVKIDQTTGTSYTPTSDGSYSIVAKDSTGTILGQSDINVSTPPPTVCDECAKLAQLLACPDWDNYMGQLTDAFKAALPPPPDWDDIANKIGNSVITKLADYVGSVPSAPSQETIDSGLNTSLPNIDANVPDVENLVPSMPPGYEEAKPFDITSGEQIPIVDESVPFEIMNPFADMQHNEPGVPVMPGSSSNNMGGIETPININLPDAMPTQQTITPGDDIPIPSSNPSSGPVPNSSGGSGPIPTIIP
jgi:hypothetical protein